MSTNVDYELRRRTAANRLSFRIARTPLTFLPRFSDALGGPVYIKQDDVGPISWAGTKARKIARILDDALAHDVQAIVMCGPAQSNSCRALAAAAVSAGIKPIILLRGEAPAWYSGNLRILSAVGAQLHWGGDVSWPQLALKARAMAQALNDDGLRTVEVAPGCSNTLGVIALIDAALELNEQLAQESVKAMRIVHASASGGMHAGLSIAHQVHGTPAPHSVMIVSDIYEDVPAEYGILVRQSLQALGITPMAEYVPELDWSQLGAGYGIPTTASEYVADLLAQTEGLLVDPVYTAKALAAVPDLVKRFPGESIVFWHSGGLPIFFN